MLKQIEIESKWGTYEQVLGLYKTERDVRIKIRLLEVKLCYEGKKSEEIAELLSESGSTVREHLKRYNRHGYNGLKDIPHPEAESIMNDMEMIEIDKALESSPRAVNINKSNWTGPLLKQWIEKRFVKTVSRTTAYNILNRLRYSIPDSLPRSVIPELIRDGDAPGPARKEKRKKQTLKQKRNFGQKWQI